MKVIGVDPGTEESGVVVFDGTKILHASILPNQDVLDALSHGIWRGAETTLVLEKIESYGMAVGESTFRTVFWSGRFAQAWMPHRFEQMGRRIVKQHLCYSAKATDANIRQAILDRYGSTREQAIGVKKSPGPLYQLKGHTWAAFAVALTWFDLNNGKPEQIRPGVTAEF